MQSNISLAVTAVDLVKKLSAFQILILKMLRILVLRICLISRIWARCWMYWEMISDMESDVGINHVLKLNPRNCNKIRFILFFCNCYSNIRRVLYYRDTIHPCQK